MKILRNSSELKFVTTLFIFSIFLGIIFGVISGVNGVEYLDILKDTISNNHINTYLICISEISLIYLLSLTCIVFPIIYFIILYEGISIGLTSTFFFNTCGTNGIIFYLVFILVTKLIALIILIYYATISTSFSIRVIKKIYIKNMSEISTLILRHTFRYIIILIFTIINSTIIYFLSTNILKKIVTLI